MGKFRSKLKGQTKGKRWAKGQSSSSNPETRKYRDQAKSSFFQEHLGLSNLTSDALKKHDTLQYTMPNKQPGEAMDQDTESNYSFQSSYKTLQSFASDWSDCSNMSFNRFLKVFRSDSALHKEMLAILAAITELIKENGGSETPTEYFCALNTALEQIMSAEERSEDQVTAVLSLINMGIKTVPTAVLQTSFNKMTEKLLVALNQYCYSENNAIIKSIFGIFGECLKRQELSVWSHLQTQQIFNSILNPFCIHTKPKWRKAAQQAAISIVNSEVFQNDNNYNPAADIVAEFCKKSLEACLGSNMNNTILVSSIQAGQTTILHSLMLMKDTISHFSKSHVKDSCETLLRLMSLNYPIVTSCSLQVLHSLFSAQKAVVSPKLNGQVITALYDYQPSTMDVQPSLAWLAVMQQAHVHLADVDLNLSCAALPKIFGVITQLWLSHKSEIVMGATRALEMLLKDGLGPACSTPDLPIPVQQKMAKCFEAIELGLGYQYNHAWHQVLHTIFVMFEVGGVHYSHMLMSCLKTLSELRDSYKFSYNNELEHAVGAAIRSMGPEKVLSVISLKKENGELNLDRSWMLPVLKENVRCSTLDFWVRGILPLAHYCQKRSIELAASNDGIGAHSAELLHLQFWNLLPSFCNNPTDISTGFKSVAKVLGIAISERKELRLAVMASLRKLIASAKASENQEDIAEIARFDKNYVPILFNVYTTKAVGTDEEGQRLAALDTIKIYLSISNPSLTKNLFENALERQAKITDPEEMFLKESILDLIRALLPYQTAENIEKMYTQCIKQLPEIKNNREQKKAYRLLEEICGSEAEGVKEFWRKNRKSVHKLLLKSLNSAAVSSKGARLRCLNYLLKAQPQLDHESTLIKSTIPEAILCCKDINERCRHAAYDLIITIGEILQKHDQLQQFIEMIMAGLAGNPQLMAATILALSSVLHQFTGALGNSNIDIILQNILLLLVIPTREIVGSCISFLKIFISSLPIATVGTSLPKIISSISKINEDCKRHHRMKIKKLLERLVRKFGSDALTPHVGTSDVVMYKWLRNIRKTQNRMKRHKEAEEEREEQGEDMEKEFMVKARPKSVEEILADSDSDFNDEDETRNKQKKYSTYIEEDADTIVDFKDPTVVSKIMASKPIKNILNVPLEDQKKKSKDRGFKTASDGRLIIDGNSSDSDDGKQKNKFYNTIDSDSDNDALSAAETEILRDRKRKRTDTNSVASDGVKPKYTPGGSGIHRRVAMSTAGSMYSAAGSEYKSKKAAGDVKKKEKHDPYAYLPLQRSALNKRKKTKRLGQFKNIVGAAKSGAKKGMKAKRNKK